MSNAEFVNSVYGRCAAQYIWTTHADAGCQQLVVGDDCIWIDVLCEYWNKRARCSFFPTGAHINDDIDVTHAECLAAANRARFLEERVHQRFSLRSSQVLDGHIEPPIARIKEIIHVHPGRCASHCRHHVAQRGNEE